MKKFRRAAAYLVCAAMAAGMLGGCGGSQTAKEESTTKASEAESTAAESESAQEESPSPAADFQAEMDWERIGWQPDPETWSGRRTHHGNAGLLC